MRDNEIKNIVYIGGIFYVKKNTNKHGRKGSSYEKMYRRKDNSNGSRQRGRGNKGVHPAMDIQI